MLIITVRLIFYCDTDALRICSDPSLVPAILAMRFDMLHIWLVFVMWMWQHCARGG
jgi:hypothetical protein